MSGRRGRPAGDHYEEPGGYDPAATYQGEQGHPVESAPAYGEQPVDGYGQPIGQPVEHYGQPVEGYGGYAEPAQYAQPAEYGAYGYQQESYPQTYAEPVVEPPVAGYGHQDSTSVLPAITEPGPGGYGYDGATSLLPAIVDTGVEADPAGAEPYGYPDEPADAYDPDFDLGHGHESADEPAYVPAQRAPVSAPREPREPRAARTPIWDPPGLLPALCTVGLAAVLAVTAIAGKPALVLGVAFLQVVTAAGWFRLNGMWPARQGIALVVLASFATDVAVFAKGEQGLASVPAVLAVTLLVLLALQARSGARPGELLPALTVTTSAALISAFDVAYLVAGDLEGGPMDPGAAVVPAVLAAGVATLVRAVPLPAILGPIAAWLLGTAAGAAAGVALGGDAPYAGLLGAGAAVLGLLGGRVAGYDHPSRFVHFTAGVSLPLALAAPAAYLLGRVMIG
ncbi:hypothetical protein [Embleya sp. NBC_00896]|uniref:hypothetical protein n=1 Tax=Embleya sp. NBC_00896 TaxID=2975961 RepID=UPI00386A92A2|nr:hypothetical protein OG928_15135 [Embleya sp. NBC_00896]